MSPSGHRRARPVRTGAVSIVVAEIDGVGAATDAIADLDLPGEGHEVVVPRRTPEDRRHWHTGCWHRRNRRR